MHVTIYNLINDTARSGLDCRRTNTKTAFAITNSIHQRLSEEAK